MLSIPAELTQNYFLMAAGRNLPDMTAQKMQFQRRPRQSCVIPKPTWRLARGIASHHEACVLPAKIRLETPDTPLYQVIFLEV
jgi:hypothetical protein